MTCSKELATRAAWWMALLTLQSIASPAIAEGASVLERVLSTLDDGAPLAEPSRTRGSMVLNIAANRSATADGGTEGIDGSVTVRFDRGSGALLSEAVSGLTTVRSFQRMEGSVGDVETVVLGASLDRSASIHHAGQPSREEGARPLDEVSYFSHGQLQTVAANIAMNQTGLDGSVSIEANGYDIGVGTLSTSVIGAAGGGLIRIGQSLPEQEEAEN